MLDPSLSFDAVKPPAPGSSSWHLAWRWVERHERKFVVAAVILQVLVLVSMIGLHALPFLTGRRIQVPVKVSTGYGPMHDKMFNVTYAFSEPPARAIDGVPASIAQQDYEVVRWLKGRPIYVTLEPQADGLTYHAVRWSIERPQGGVYLVGKPTDSYSYRRELFFGIEWYDTASESEWTAIQAALGNGTAIAELAVTSSGVAKLVKIK